MCIGHMVHKCWVMSTVMDACLKVCLILEETRVPINGYAHFVE